MAKLKKGKIICEETLKILVNDRGIVNFDLLDPEVSDRSPPPSQHNIPGQQ